MRRCAVLAAASVLTACSVFVTEPAWKLAVAGDGPGDPSLVFARQVKVENLPRSRSGNQPEYEVFGNRYQVLDSAAGFQETGVASWYGSKFHGRATASGEIYDMHELTAAHKHLPLPTFVRVTRLDNGQSVIVKVNDRGPFVEERIIDLSYAAAVQLDMLDSGKAEVRIETIRLAAAAQSPSPPQPVTAAVPASAHYVQLGAFNESLNADAMIRRVVNVTDLPTSIDFDTARQLYQVRVGPLGNDDDAQEVLSTLAKSGLSGFLVARRVVAVQQ